MATVREIAALAGVSPSTVSRVINGNVPVKDSLRNKVLSAIQRLDDMDRSGSAKWTHGTVGIIMPTASAKLLGRIFQYVGETNPLIGFTKGAYYVCEEDTTVNPSIFKTTGYSPCIFEIFSVRSSPYSVSPRESAWTNFPFS